MKCAAVWVPYVAILALVSAVLGASEMDLDFCNKYKPSLAIPDAHTPEFKDIASLMEITVNAKKLVADGRIVKSVSQNKLHLNMRNAYNQSSVYAFANSDVLVDMTKQGRESWGCKADPLQDSTLARDFNILPDRHTGKLQIPEFSHFVPASQTSKALRIDEPKVVRGIPVTVYFVCAYQDWVDTTVAFNISYSKRGFMVGAFNEAPVMINAVHKKASSSEEYIQRVDFTHFRATVDPHNKHLQLPSDLWCDGRPKDFMGEPAGTFQFSTEMVDLGDFNVYPPAAPSLNFNRETANIPKTSLIESESTGDDYLSKYRQRVFHDFTTGLAYDENLSAGTCDQHAIQEGPDFAGVVDNQPQMKSPNAYFLLDRDYQYNGEHSDMDRGILTDVYTSLKNYGTEEEPDINFLIWHFASKRWMTDIMKFPTYYMLPIRLITMANNVDGSHKRVLDFYEYTRTPYAFELIPDLSACFATEDIMYLDMLVDGLRARFNVNGRRQFEHFFRIAVMKQAGLNTSTSVANIRVEQLQDDRYPDIMQVRFTLLAGGYNDKAYKLMQDQISNGKFQFLDSNQLGNHVHRVLGIRKHRSGKQVPFYMQGSSSSSSKSGYSPGAMGGLAVGMIILGLLLGFVGTKGFLRFKHREQDTQQMQVLGKVLA